MNEKDFRAILNSIDQTIEVFERGPPPTGSAREAYEKLKTLREAVQRAYRDVADGQARPRPEVRG